jgi:hypothetical protein
MNVSGHGLLRLPRIAIEKELGQFQKTIRTALQIGFTDDELRKLFEVALVNL